MIWLALIVNAVKAADVCQELCHHWMALRVQRRLKQRLKDIAQQLRKCLDLALCRIDIAVWVWMPGCRSHAAHTTAAALG